MLMSTRLIDIFIYLRLYNGRAPFIQDNLNLQVWKVQDDLMFESQLVLLFVLLGAPPTVNYPLSNIRDVHYRVVVSIIYTRHAADHDIMVFMMRPLKHHIQLMTNNKNYHLLLHSQLCCSLL